MNVPQYQVMLKKHFEGQTGFGSRPGHRFRRGAIRFELQRLTDPSGRSAWNGIEGDNVTRIRVIRLIEAVDENDRVRYGDSAEIDMQEGGATLDAVKLIHKAMIRLTLETGCLTI
jgi:hypothetical protein